MRECWTVSSRILRPLRFSRPAGRCAAAAELSSIGSDARPSSDSSPPSPAACAPSTEETGPAASAAEAAARARRSTDSPAGDAVSSAPTAVIGADLRLPRSSTAFDAASCTASTASDPDVVLAAGAAFEAAAARHPVAPAGSALHGAAPLVSLRTAHGAAPSVSASAEPGTAGRSPVRSVSSRSRSVIRCRSRRSSVTDSRAARRPAPIETHRRNAGTATINHGRVVRRHTATVPSRTPVRMPATRARWEAATRRRSRASPWARRARVSSRSVRSARTFLTAGLFIALTSGRRRKICACPLLLQASSEVRASPVARTRNSEE